MTTIVGFKRMLKLLEEILDQLIEIEKTLKEKR